MNPLVVLSLNVWRGACLFQLISFIQEMCQSVDVFCFQEVYSSEGAWENATRVDFEDEHGKYRITLFEQLVHELREEFDAYFVPTESWTEEDPTHRTVNPVANGNAIFVRKGIPIREYGERLIVTPLEIGSPRWVQWLTITRRGVPYTILNYHGIWTGGGKGDTEERKGQSIRLCHLIQRLDGKKILVGDFNLLPDTESIAILSGADGGMRNLIMAHSIQTTRSSFVRSSLAGDDARFADYVFVSNDIEVVSFDTLNVLVSDHLPIRTVVR